MVLNAILLLFVTGPGLWPAQSADSVEMEVIQPTECGQPRRKTPHADPDRRLQNLGNGLGPLVGGI